MFILFNLCFAELFVCRVRLSKRRQKIGQPPNNTRLVVKHRPLNAQEFRMQRYRERQLEPPGEEEEEDEEDEEQQTQDDAGDQETVVTNDQDDANKSGQSLVWGCSLVLHTFAVRLVEIVTSVHVPEIMNEDLERRRHAVSNWWSY